MRDMSVRLLEACRSCQDEIMARGSVPLKLCRCEMAALSRRLKSADPLGKRYKFRQGLGLHFLHHSVAVGLDGAFGRSQRVGDLLVGIAANDKVEDLPLTRRQSPEAGAHAVQLVLQTA